MHNANTRKKINYLIFLIVIVIHSTNNESSYETFGKKHSDRCRKYPRQNIDSCEEIRFLSR